MASSPATPDKANIEAAELSRASGHSFNQVKSASKVQHASVLDPSPASTYGDTAGTSSVPATPLDNRKTDPTATLVASMRAAQLDDAIQSISVSPAGGRKDTSYASSERRGDGNRVASSALSSSSSGRVAAFGPGSNASAHSSPSASRYQDIMQSPHWRAPAGFVRQSGGGADDPFVSAQENDQTGDQATGSPYRPREDRAGVQLSGDNAQAVLPPNACVFVANLVSSKTDEQLEYSVTKAFEVFGSCYVKIRRDNKGMPFAFCQYENVGDAQRAITCGRGMMIDGRPCRTEVAKVNRSLYLSKVTGEPISEEDARELMGRYGALERVWFCTQTDKEMFRLPEGIWVMFAFFQDCRDAQAGFRDHNLYRLEQPRMPDEMRARLLNRGKESPLPAQQRVSPGYARRPQGSPQAHLRRIIDLCSIFVGNLPSNVDEEMLRTAFGACGRICHVEIVRKPSMNQSGLNIFAFIEFSLHEEAAFALQQTVSLQGSRLRIEQKESIDPYSRRDLATASNGSPRSRYIAESQDALALLFQRGVTVGMANAVTSQAQTMPAPNYGAAAYPYYSPFNQTQYGQYFPQATIALENESASGLQMHGNPYLPSSMTSVQYPTALPSYVPRYPQVAPRPTNYQWPPPNDSNTETANAATTDNTSNGENQ